MCLPVCLSALDAESRIVGRGLAPPISLYSLLSRGKITHMPINVSPLYCVAECSNGDFQFMEEKIETKKKEEEKINEALKSLHGMGRGFCRGSRIDKTWLRCCSYA